MASKSPKRLTHKERAERRARMAKAVRGGQHPAEVARREGVSLELVRQVCTVYGVPFSAPSTAASAA